jgi:hypothetical protein
MLRFVPFVYLVFLFACANQNTVPADAPTATVLMRDGTNVQGKIIESTPTQIRISSEGKPAQTILLSQVKRVDYAAAPPADSVAAAPAPPAPHAPAAPAPAEEEHVHAPSSAVTSRTSVLPVGTEISVRNEETIDSGKAVEGQTFAADVIRDVKDADGDVVIPRGANARIVILSASGGGKFKGKADLALDLASVSIDGKQYRLSTSNLVQKGRDGVGVNKRTGTFAGGGAAVGAIIGAIAGGGKGAAIGAGSGAGAGALAEIVTKGGSIKIPVESRLTFKLDQPLKVVDSI